MTFTSNLPVKPIRLRRTAYFCSLHAQQAAHNSALASFESQFHAAAESIKAKARQVEGILREFSEVRYTLATINTGNAAEVRLRPILMTTLAMIFGMLPLALALTEGSEQRAPMGQAVIGGVITSSLLTLVVVPVVYCYMDDLAQWLRRRWGAQSQAGESAGG